MTSNWFPFRNDANHRLAAERRTFGGPARFALMLIAPLLLFAQMVVAQTTTSQDITLELNKPVEQKLTGGQVHLYRIAIAAGEVVRVVTEQIGIDVVVALFGPDGKQLTKVDSPNGNQGPETLVWVAEISGDYRIEVRSFEWSVSGRYEIRIAERRAGTAEDRALSQAFRLLHQALDLRDQKKLNDAAAAAEQAVATVEKMFSPEHPNLLAALELLATVYSGLPPTDKSLQLDRRLSAFYEKSPEKNVRALATVCLRLGMNFYVRGDYAQAETQFQSALKLREQALGSEDSSVIVVLNRLAILYRDTRDYLKAEDYYQRLVTLSEKRFGPDHPSTINYSNGFASLYSRMGNYEKAGQIYQRILERKEKALGADHPEVADVLNNLGSLYRAEYDYARAMQTLQRVLIIREKVLGPDHPAVANALLELATIYQRQGDYAQVIALRQRALAIKENQLGPNHPEIATSLRDLANVYFGYLGDFAKAGPLLERALAICEKTGSQSQIAYTLLMMGQWHYYQNDFVKAEPLLERALAIAEKAYAPDHPMLAVHLFYLGDFYQDAGMNRVQTDTSKAEPLLRRALAIQEKAFGPEAANLKLTLDSLGWLAYVNGDYAQAESWFRSDLAILEKAFGPNQYEVCRSLNGLAAVLQKKGDLQGSLALIARSGQIEDSYFYRHLAVGSERQKLALQARLWWATDYALRMHAQFMPDYAPALDHALTTLLRRKGRALDVMADAVAQLRRHADAQGQALLDGLSAARAQLSTIRLSGAEENAPAVYRARAKQLEEQIETIESAISARSTEFHLEVQPVTVEAVRAALPANSALVEFALYRRFDEQTKTFASAHYAAYVLPARGGLKWVALGETAPIDQAIASWRQALRDKRRADVKRLARTVDEKVMRRVRPLLGNTRRIFISPDGPLNLIPFAALVDERNRYLVTRYSFGYLSSGRDLLRLRLRRQSKSAALVVANPAFGAAPSGGPGTGRIPLTKKSTKNIAPLPDFSRVPLRPLPGTAEEARTIKRLLAAATVLTGERATEMAVKQASGPRILHIATHGFFLEDIALAAGNTRGLGLSVDSSPGVAAAGNPLLRSGLVLAGVNRPKGNSVGDDDDGILTAMEATGLDLWGTKLVVLSACDTGVGEVKNGDGVYGLRRALLLAGAESQVMSLWPVSDRGSRDLMTGYYKALQRGEGRGEALRQVQLRMLNSKDRRHPYYWASFIQSGGWQPLEEK